MTNRWHRTFLVLCALGPVAAASCSSAADPAGPEGASAAEVGEVAAGGGAGSGGAAGDALTLGPDVEALGFPDTPVGRALASHVALEMRTDAASVSLYSASFAKLRADAPGVVAELAAAYERLPEESYLARWHVVRTLAGLELREAAHALAAIALRELPPERWGPPAESHGYSSVGEEALLRVRAVAGLRSLALEGSAEASEALRQALKSPNRSVRRAAAQAHVAAGRRSPARLAEARAALPEAERAWADLRPATDEDLAVPTPEPPAPGDRVRPDAPAKAP